MYAQKKCEGEPLYEEENIVDWINKEEPVECQVTHKEIIESVLKQIMEEDSDAETDKKNFDEGLQLGKKYLKLMEQQKSITDQEVMVLYNVE